MDKNCLMLLYPNGGVLIILFMCLRFIAKTCYNRNKKIHNRTWTCIPSKMTKTIVICISQTLFFESYWEAKHKKKENCQQLLHNISHRVMHLNNLPRQYWFSSYTFWLFDVKFRWHLVLTVLSLFIYFFPKHKTFETYSPSETNMPESTTLSKEVDL